MSDMTPDEIEFFRTGELPTGLQEEASSAVNPVLDSTITMNREDEVAVVEPVVAPAEPVVVAAPAAPAEPVVDLSSLQRQIEESNRLIEQMRAQLAAPPAVPAAVETPIDANIDPLGHMMQQMNRINATVNELQSNSTKTQEASAQRAQFDTFTQAVQTAKQAFEKTTPDFNDAYAHIRTLRTEDLRLAGAPEADISKILLQDEFQLAQVALQRGKNPAEEMYNMAKRYGYAAKAAAPVAAPVVGAAAKLAALQAGQAAARNIQAAAPSAAAPTLATLRESSNNDLNNLIQNDDMWAKIVGGKSGNDIF